MNFKRKIKKFITNNTEIPKVKKNDENKEDKPYHFK